MYVPKNKIKSNLVTAGDEFSIISSGQIYTGFYYTLYNGKSYTGKFPGDGDNQLLEKIITPQIIPVSPPAQSLNTSKTLPLFPTEQDYKNGMFIRYFSKKRNEYLFEELTKDQYNQLNNPKILKFALYHPFFIKWMLTGDKQTVTDYNFYSIRNAEEKDKALGLNEFLKMDYTKYYK